MGTLHEGQIPGGGPLFVLALDDANLRVRVVAEAMQEARALVGRTVAATGALRLEDQPAYFVIFDGQEHALQGGWFLAQPRWGAVP